MRGVAQHVEGQRSDGVALTAAPSPEMVLVWAPLLESGEPTAKAYSERTADGRDRAGDSRTNGRRAGKGVRRFVGQPEGLQLGGRSSQLNPGPVREHLSG